MIENKGWSINKLEDKYKVENNDLGDNYGFTCIIRY